MRQDLRLPPELSTTSYALLGLLALGHPDDGLTGYELKQRADKTLRFYWVAPAMSQVYSELTRLEDAALVAGSAERQARRTTRRYRITGAGLAAVDHWLARSEAGFPTLKHPTALRLMMGSLLGPDRVRDLLDRYVADLALRRAELLAVHDSLPADDPDYVYPTLVAEWGLAYYDSEAAIAAGLRERLPATTADRQEFPAS